MSQTLRTGKNIDGQFIFDTVGTFNHLIKFFNVIIGTKGQKGFSVTGLNYRNTLF